MNERKSGVPLGKVFGVPVVLDLSWFLIFALLTWSLASSYYPARFDWPVELFWVMGAITAASLFGSVLLHELGHALVARAFRIPVRRIRLMIFGGVAELGDESPNAGAEFSVAAAGPLVSLLLAGVTAIGWVSLRAAGLFEPLYGLLGYLAWLNLTLVLFNLVPGFPLDGGRVLRSIIWAATGSLRRATRIAGTIGRLVAFGFIGLGVFLFFTGSVSNGLWMGFIGLFLQQAARAEMQSQAIRDLLVGRTVGQVMTRNVAPLPGDLTIRRLVDAHILGRGDRTFVIVEQGQPVGLFGVDNVRRVPVDQWPSVTLSEAMTPLGELGMVRPDTGLWPALKQMELAGIASLPVYEGGLLLGLLRHEDVLLYLRRLSILDPQLAQL
jgi:Zn-dependent protease/CBS domain-containing protein